MTKYLNEKIYKNISLDINKIILKKKMKKENEKILDLLENLDERVSSIEDKLNIETEEMPSEDIKDIPAPIEENNHNEKIVKKTPDFSVTQIITFLGISGIIIGILSLFFYAIAQNWISLLGQILIGALIGLILYGFGISFYKKKEEWSNFLIGGGLFVEFLSISVGILNFEVINPILGFILLLGFIILSIILTINFKSKIIGYYSLIGGFLIPILSGYSHPSGFILSYLLVLVIGLLIISYKFNWADLRISAFILESLYLIVYINILSSPMINSGLNLGISTTFLVINFLLFNFSSIIFAIKSKINLNAIDNLILNANSIIFISLLYEILIPKFSIIEFGFFILPIAFLYLFEIYLIKDNSKDNKEIKIMNYSILSSAIISLNLAFFFILDVLNLDFFIIPFIIEWFLFSYISKKSENKNYFLIISNIFLFLIIIWYVFIVKFDQGILHAGLYLLVLSAIPIGFLILNLLKINREINGAGFLISIFVFIFSVYTFLKFDAILGPGPISQVILSIMWLTYTLITLKLVSYNEKGKILMLFLLAITILKILIVDLTYLSGIAKILGFIIFGVILLIGGYFIKNEVNKK